ncbi:MAG: rRNA pseudouridine synthase [Candidatus Peribacteria bacterium]|nr:MAG: rRNA pseudouridine synthase [Candidatus Peribacteria bacterium]
MEEITKLPVARPKLLLFHKPAGYVVSKDDPHNKTIYKLLPEKYHKRYYIGRLDKESTGLLLLTNDPGLVDWYENPQSNIKKVYEVMIDKPFKSQHTKKACKGIIVTDEGKIANEKKNETGELLRCQQISYFRNDRGQYFVSIVLTEGKNRQIRRMLSALGYKVKSLHRTRIGQHLLGAIKSGKWSQIEVKPEK